MAASEMGGESSFDFGPEEFYPGNFVAQEIVWPMVNHVTDKDWIADSVPGDMAEEPIVADTMDYGRKYAVEISPICTETIAYLNDGSNHEYHVENFVDIIIDEEHASSYVNDEEENLARALVLGRAKINTFRKWGSFKVWDEDGDPVWLSDKHDSTIVVTSRQVSVFNETGLANQDACIALNGKKESVYTPLASKNDAFDGDVEKGDPRDANPQRLWLPNIVALELACKAFCAPNKIKAAIEKVRNSAAEIH